jgi:hypothetical protein
MKIRNIGWSLLIAFTWHATAQTINWDDTANKKRNLLKLSVGVEYGLTYQLGYARFLNNKKLPMVIDASYSLPSGHILFDDSKTSFGGQVRVAKYGNVVLSVAVHGILRRSESYYATLLNFGSDVAGTIGYYQTKWFVAAETGFDKAIETHFQHSSIYKSVYPSVTDGWYRPATGGNLYYGLIAGRAFGKHNVYFKIGKLVSQDFKTPPLIPFYGQLGYMIRF